MRPSPLNWSFCLRRENGRSAELVVGVIVADVEVDVNALVRACVAREFVSSGLEDADVGSSERNSKRVPRNVNAMVNTDHQKQSAHRKCRMHSNFRL